MPVFFIYKIKSIDCFGRPKVTQPYCYTLVSLRQGVESPLKYPFTKFFVIYVCVLSCKWKVFLMILSMMVWIEQEGNF